MRRDGRSCFCPAVVAPSFHKWATFPRGFAACLSGAAGWLPVRGYCDSRSSSGVCLGSHSLNNPRRYFPLLLDCRSRALLAPAERAGCFLWRPLDFCLWTAEHPPRMFNETESPIDHAKGESEDTIESECSASKISNRLRYRRDGISIVTENPMESACPTIGISNISRGRRDGISR